MQLAESNTLSLTTLVTQLLEPIYAVSLAGPLAVSDASLSRRYMKLYEELGEVSEAYLDVTGSGAKGKTYADVLEEQADAFIVMVDICILGAARRFASLRTPLQQGLEELRCAMQRHVAKVFTEAATDTFDSALRGASLRAALAHGTVGSPNEYSAALVASGAIYALLCHDAQALGGQERALVRLSELVNLVQAKTTKWRLNREAHRCNT